MTNIVFIILMIFIIWLGINNFGYMSENFGGGGHSGGGGGGGGGHSGGRARRWGGWGSRGSGGGWGPWYWGYFPPWYYGPPLLNAPYYAVPTSPYEWPYNGELTEYGYPTWVSWFNWPYRQRPWIYYREGFDEKSKESSEKEQNMSNNFSPRKDDNIFRLGGPAPYTWKEQTTPYHLLNIPKPCEKEIISNTNSRNCYASNFQRLIEKVGSYAQQTNNYKHSRPDVCHSPYQELVMSFYRMDRFPGSGSPES